MDSSAPKVRAIEPDDAVLIERFRKGDQRAFDEIYYRHSKVVATMVYRMLGDDFDLDDIVQETFVVAARKIASVQDASKLRSWLITIAVRRVSDEISRRRKRRMMQRVFKRHAPVASKPEATSELEDLLEALDTISAKLRVPWTLHRVEGATIAETAELCGLSTATVKRRVRDADELLDRRLEDES